MSFGLPSLRHCTKAQRGYSIPIRSPVSNLMPDSLAAAVAPIAPSVEATATDRSRSLQSPN